MNQNQLVDQITGRVLKSLKTYDWIVLEKSTMNSARRFCQRSGRPEVFAADIAGAWIEVDTPRELRFDPGKYPERKVRVARFVGSSPKIKTEIVHVRGNRAYLREGF